jgi:hypothetical protein
VPFLKKKNQKGTLERSQTAQLHPPNLPFKFPLRNPGPGAVLKVKKNQKGTLERSQTAQLHPPDLPLKFPL